jgi:hypothetical protein
MTELRFRACLDESGLWKPCCGVQSAQYLAAVEFTRVLQNQVDDWELERPWSSEFEC